MRRVATAVAWLLAPALLLAAQASQPPVFRSGVDMVDVAVVVCDEQGRFVPGLTSADFEVLERGLPQKIAVFDRVSIPIWRPRPGAAPLPLAADVSSNETLAEGRLFVLVLDALHVAPANLTAVREQAKTFIREHMGPADLAAVLSPGALAEATQDFTVDKARLIAAIDHFVGGKLASATLEIEEERRSAVLGGMMPHAGRDPSDGERAYRARSLSSVLGTLADHLARVERRRKALLLFSEGIDYNTADLNGTVQRYAAEVHRAMDQALGALMRSNVSLYAIDPRGLASADTAAAKVPYRLAATAPRADGSLPPLDFSEPTLEGEYASSIASLRSVSEPTGGFALTTGNDPAVAFDRIVRESSDYYVVGYTPASRGKPGEFQPIRVRVRRPDVRVIARSGYTVPAPTRVRADANSVEAPPEPANRFAFSRGRPVEPLRVDAAPPAAAPGGLHADLAWLLSSPVPVVGLPIRVHAAAFKGNDKEHVVQVVTEVLGSALSFVERGGRFESRLELASFTVDSDGDGANGRSTTIELRLTKEEFDRVRATGVRWMSQLELTAGRYQLRVAGRAPATRLVGMVTADVDVPPFGEGATLSSVTLTSVASSTMVTRGQAKLASVLGGPPSVERVFAAGDRIVAAVEVYAGASGAWPRAVTAAVEHVSGRVVLEREEKLPQAAGARPSTVSVPIDTSSMPPGRYVFRVRLDHAPPTPYTERRVPFDVIPAPPR